MNKLFVPYDIALKLKEKGFDEKCFTFYWDDIGIYKDLQYGNHNKVGSSITVSAPLYQQVVDWFLIKHKIFLEILVFNIGALEDGEFCFQWRIYNNSEEWETIFKEFSTTKEAMDSAINEALNLI